MSSSKRPDNVDDGRGEYGSSPASSGRQVMQMKLRQLEVLHAILQTGSVTNAAKLLAVSQPSVSAVLQHCELQLGMRLFERVGGRLKPSPEALALLPEIREIFRRVDRVSESARSLAQGRLGKISVAGTLALANGYLVDAVSEFQKHHSDVEVTIHALQTPDLVERVVAQQFHLGICYGPITNTALEVEPIASRGMVCVMPAEHPLTSRSCITVDDIADEALITYDAGDWLRQKVDDFLASGENWPRFSVQVSQTITAIQLVSKGAGIAVVEPFFFAATKPAGLVAVPLEPAQQLSVEMIRPRGVVESAAVSAFIATLQRVARTP